MSPRISERACEDAIECGLPSLFSIVRQVRYSKKNENSLDLVVAIDRTFAREPRA